ncbi:hypothetical protein JCM16418_2859 [Paenibacillus pini JCM 16418]|uniref:Tyrosine protein kinase n=1 Tax=Paenibacillus pini JCM 16418 TaxID=1236976 RepID=W7Z2T5_9BACL|nr:hypothetical protein JCM16418_2859 [Paenibacillus pini JCM 16418]
MNNPTSLAQSPYPGIQPYMDLPGVGTTGLAPYQGASGLAGAAELISPGAAAAPLAAAASAKTGAFSLANLGELKGVIDRMGGIDGLMNSMGKFQKVVSGVQQMAPMLKLFTGFGKGKTNGKSSSDEFEYKPSKRRRRKPSSSRKRRNPSKRYKKRSTSRRNSPSHSSRKKRR